MGEITVFDAIKEDNEIWLLDGSINCLFKFNEDTENVEYVVSVDNGVGVAVEYGSMIRYKQLMLLFPVCAENIAVYNMEQKKCTFIPLPKEYLKLPPCNPRQAKTAFAYLHKNRVYAFGGDYPGVIIFYPDTNEVSYISMEEPLKDLLIDNENGYFTLDYAVKDGTLYAPIWTSDVICTFCLESMEYTLLALGKSISCAGCCITEEQIWLTHWNESKISLIDKEMNVRKTIQITGVEKEEFKMSELEVTGKYIYIYTYEYIIKIGIHDCNINVKKYTTEGCCLRVKVFDGIIYQFHLGKIVIKMQEEDSEKEMFVKLKADDKVRISALSDIMNGSRSKDIIYYENSFWKLRDYIEVVSSNDQRGNRHQEEIGKKIYDMTYGLCSEKQGK